MLAFIFGALFCPLYVSEDSDHLVLDGLHQHEALTPSPSFNVTIDGIPQFVYMATADAAGFGSYSGMNASFVYVHLERSSRKRIVITPLKPFKTASLRPTSSVTLQRTSGPSIAFDLQAAGNFILELDGDHEFRTLSHGLMIFADYVEAPAAATVYFGPGVHSLPYDRHLQNRVLWLQNNSVVHIDVGAVVLGYIRGYKVQNVTIRGRGILAASFLPGEPIPASQRAASWCGYYGPVAIEIINSSDVTLEGITVVHSTSWDVKFDTSIGVYIRGIKIIAWQCMNDGIDLSSSQNVLVEQSFIRSNDDAVAIKGRTPNVDTKDIMIRDTILWGQSIGNCMEIGFEVWNAEVKNITFLRNICFHSNRAVMSIHNAGHTAVKDILYQDIVAEGVLPMYIDYNPGEGLQLIDLTITSGKYSGPDMDRRGSIDNIRFSNITYNPNKIDYLFSRILGNSSRHKISNILFSDFRIGTKPMTSLSDLNATSAFLGPVHFDRGRSADAVMLI